MRPTDAEMRAAEDWLSRFSMSGLPRPFSFNYGGAQSSELIDGWDGAEVRGDPENGKVSCALAHTVSDSLVRVQASVTQFVHLPAIEWVVTMRNDGEHDNPIISDLQAMDCTLPLAPGDPCTIHYSLGALCSRDDFAPKQRNLRPKGSLRLTAGFGRSSSEVLPFFNIDLGGKGFILGIGWTGEWAVQFDRTPQGELRVRVGMDHTHLKLHPGEEIRTPRVLVIPWEGEPIRGHNLLRRHILAHHRPTQNGEPLVAPLCTGNWGGTSAEVHLDNLSKIVEHDLPFEYYWIDAEWFGGPGHWMEHAGNWEPRKDLYPEGFGPISDAAHRSGRKFLLWFEFERVAPGTPWAEEHADWLLSVPDDQAVTWAHYGDHMDAAEWVKWEARRNQLGAGDRLLDLGNPDALRFLTDYLSEKITRHGIDCLRQDSNVAHLAYWRNADAPDRQGITEIRYVEGQYALWDQLLQRHPGLIIDNCASGGRRIDLESISRATPLWRTDFTVGHADVTPVQAHTWGMMHWVPITGTGGGYLHQWDRYTLRSKMCASLVVGLWGHGDAPQGEIPDDYPYEHARELLEEYLLCRPYFYGDFYPLTEYTLAEDTWMAYQLHLPAKDEGLLVVLKRPRSPYKEATFHPRALQPEVRYAFETLDGSVGLGGSGALLMDAGITIELLATPDSVVYRYWPCDES